MPVKDPFLAGVLASMPEADRAKAEARLIELEEGGLRQADYSKVVAEARAAKTEADDLLARNQAWFTEREAALKEVDTLRARVAAGGDPKPVVGDQGFKLPEGLITKDELTKILDATERGAVGFISEANVLSLKHYKDFGEVLNITELMMDPSVQKIGLKGVYEQKFKEQITAKAKAADDARAEAFRVEGEQRALQRMQQQRGPGYPVVGNEPSSLDALEAARATDGKVQVKSLDDMASEYARLNASRMGGGSAAP
jgi:hypothetical protein